MDIHQFLMAEKIAKHLASNQYKKQNIIIIRNGTKLKKGDKNETIICRNVNRYRNCMFILLCKYYNTPSAKNICIYEENSNEDMKYQE